MLRSARLVKGAAPLYAAGAEPRAGPPVLRGRNEHGEHPPFDQPEHRDNRSGFRSGRDTQPPSQMRTFLLRALFHITLQWLSDPDLRQRSHAGLNKGEASNALRRAVFFHRQGEIRDRTFENQGFRASGLSLITAAIVHWNTVYLHRAVQHARALGATIPDDLLAHVAPLGWEHIALTGDYVWTTSNAAPDFRSLRDVPSAFMPRAA
jgi:Tn3 transposase DDE domain